MLRDFNRFACNDKANDSEIKLNYVALYQSSEHFEPISGEALDENELTE